MNSTKTVLAIDDNVQMLNELKSMLTARYDLRPVKSASEAISFLNKTHADVILLDIEMPNISGFEFLKDIRKIPSYFLTPVIIITGNSGHEFFEQARSSSAAGVLIKPVNPDELVSLIEKSLVSKS